MIKKISAVIIPYALSDGDIRFSICAKKVSGCSLTLNFPNTPAGVYTALRKFRLNRPNNHRLMRCC